MYTWRDRRDVIGGLIGSPEERDGVFGSVRLGPLLLAGPNPEQSSPVRPADRTKVSPHRAMIRKEMREVITAVRRGVAALYASSFLDRMIPIDGPAGRSTCGIDRDDLSILTPCLSVPAVSVSRSSDR